ncbi:MAG TPA: hypothetical protein VK194_00415, partial [Candidatus Deferrimicrobium sp.]|nr:hypothetical protein [Candidatus Deferrimicrobium sp.]
EPIPSDGGRAPTRVVPWGDRVLAVGVGDAPCAHPQGDGMWVRAAGGTWTEAPFDQLFCTGGTFDVAATAARAVIAGTSTGETAYVWASDDGLRWTDRSQPFEGFAPQAVTAVGDGFVAFGRGSTGVWVSVSSDGSSWGSPQVTVPLNDTSVVAAVTLDGRPLAIVRTTQGQVGLLELADGAWTSRAATGLDANGLVRVVATGDGLVALGDRTGGAGAWVSVDGVAWRAIELPDRLHATGANVAGAAIDGERAAIVGNVPLPDGTSMGSIWTGPSSLLAP